MEQYHKFKPDEAYHTYFGPISVVWTTNAKEARRIIMDRKIFKQMSLPASSAGGLLIAKAFGNMGEENWKKYGHNVIFPAFANLESFFPTFNDTIDECIQAWDAQIVNGTAVIDTPDMMGKMTLDVLGRCLFNYDLKCMSGQANKLREHYNFVFPQFLSMNEMVLPFLKKLPTKYGRDFTYHYNGFINGMNQIISEAREKRKNNQNTGDKSLLDSMLEATESDNGLDFTDEMVLHNISAFFLAGHESTATALEVVLWCLARHQDVQQKVYEEVEKVIQPDGFLPYEKLPELDYLYMTLKESFRLYLVGSGFLREVQEDVIISGYHVPKGFLVGVNQSAMCMRPDYWDKPEEFDPERFNAENSKGRPSYLFAPFSLGAHTCTGNNFSIMEQKMFIAKVLHRYQLVLPKGQEVLKYRPYDQFNAIDDNTRIIIKQRK